MARQFRLTLGLVLLSGVFSNTPMGFAAHPLITDDTGTQDRGGFQTEFDRMLGYDKGRQTQEQAHELVTTVSYGIGDNTDLVLGLPHQRFTIRDRAGDFKSSGIADVSLETINRVRRTCIVR